MKKHIKKAAISELPVLLKGIGIIIFTLLCYFAGIVFADYATGRELNYFEDINNYVEEKLAEFKPSPTPVAMVTNKPTQQPFARKTPEPPKFRTTTLTKDDFQLKIEKEILDSYSTAEIFLIKDDTELASTSLDMTNSNITSFLYVPDVDTLFYVINSFTSEDNFIEVIEMKNFANFSDNTPRITDTLEIRDGGKHGLFGIRILGYEESTNSLIVRMGAGDGCGGSGNIWTLNDNSKEKIIDYSVGCAADTGDYKFLAYFEGKVLYYEELGEWQTEQAGDILSYDVTTGQREVFLPVSYYPDGTIQISQSYEDETILKFYYTDNLGYDLKTGQIVEITD